RAGQRLQLAGQPVDGRADRALLSAHGRPPQCRVGIRGRGEPTTTGQAAQRGPGRFAAVGPGPPPPPAPAGPARRLGGGRRGPGRGCWGGGGGPGARLMGGWGTPAALWLSHCPSWLTASAMITARSTFQTLMLITGVQDEASGGPRRRERAPRLAREP